MIVKAGSEFMNERGSRSAAVYCRRVATRIKIPLFYLLVVCLATLLIAVYFRSQGLYPQFLRCESGSYLNYAANWKNAKAFWLTNLSTHAYNGHYAPIAFGLELIQARLIGLHPGIWLVRQSFALAFLGMSFAFFINIFSSARLVYPWIVPAVLSIIYIAQPAFIDFMAWPFMIMQIGCLSFAFLGLYYLIKYYRDRRTLSLFQCLLFSYGTMQWFGVGFAFDAAALVTVSWLVFGEFTKNKAASKQKICFLVIFCVICAVHACVMVFRNYGEALPFPTLMFVASHLGVFYLRMLFSGLQSIWMPGVYVIPNPTSFAADNLFGWAVIGIVSVIVVSSLRLEKRSGNKEYAIVLLYALVGSLVYVSLMLLRLQTTPDEWKGAFVVGPRYVVFGSFFAILLSVSCFIEISGPIRLGNASMLMIVAAVIGGNALFIRDVMPVIWPATLSNNRAIWENLEDSVKQAIEANQPIPNLAINVGECPRTARDMEETLRRSLGIKRDVDLQWTE